MTKPRLYKKPVLRAAAGAVTIAVFAVAFSGSAATDAHMQKPKSETVYALLGSDGSYSGATVVNCFVPSGQIVDYGDYTSVTNLMGDEPPIIEGDKIIWPATLTQSNKRFYYQGETDKPLPLDFDIVYHLNGRQVSAEHIAGQTGELKVTFEITNNTGTGEINEPTGREILTPFAAQVSLSLDSGMYTVLDIPKNATAVHVGETHTLSYASFPLPLDTFSFTLFGTNMQPPPISIVVVPKSPPGLDAFGDYMDIEGIRSGTEDMIEGTDDMLDGTGELLSGLRTLKDAVEEMKNGLASLSSGTRPLSSGAGELAEGLRALAASAGEFQAGVQQYAAAFAAFDAGMDTLQESTLGMTASLAELRDAAAALDTGIGGLSSDAQGIASSNQTLRAMAEALALAYPDDAGALASGLQAQQAAIGSFADSINHLAPVANGLSGGLQSFYAGFSTDFAQSVSGLRMGSAALYQNSLELIGGAAAISEACTNLVAAADELSGGTAKLGSGAKDAAVATDALYDALDDMTKGLKTLEDGIKALGDEGLLELKEGIDGLEAYLLKLSDMADAYGSFMDERNAAHSTVQFIFKTQDIKAE